MLRDRCKNMPSIFGSQDRRNKRGEKRKRGKKQESRCKTGFE